MRDVVVNPRKRRLPDPPDPDDPTRKAPPAPLADLMAALSAKRGWDRRLDGAQIHVRWREIAGDELAAHAEPVRLHGGVLVLRVDSPLWATQVRYLSGDLADRANTVLGQGTVARVTVTTGRLQGPHREPEAGP
jgi:predicted nucleic acid-binding Zn ribbon protein